MNPADFREGLELWSTPEINGKSMLDITVIAFSSKSPGTKYLFVGRSRPFSSSCTAVARKSSARTAPGGTSPPTALTSSVKLGLSPSKHKSKGEPSGPTNLWSKCHACKTRAGGPAWSAAPLFGPSLSKVSSDTRRTSFRDSPVLTATRDALVTLPFASRSSNAS